MSATVSTTRLSERRLDPRQRMEQPPLQPPHRPRPTNLRHPPLPHRPQPPTLPGRRQPNLKSLLQLPLIRPPGNPRRRGRRPRARLLRSKRRRHLQQQQLRKCQLPFAMGRAGCLGMGLAVVCAKDRHDVSGLQAHARELYPPNFGSAEKTKIHVDRCTNSGKSRRRSRISMICQRS